MNLWDYLLRSDGLIFGSLFLGMALALAVLIVRLGLGLRRGRTLPSLLVREIEGRTEGSDVSRLLARSRSETSFLGRVVAAALSRHRDGRSEAREAAVRTACDLEATLRQPLSYLAMIGILSILVGLAGTVLGVVILLMVSAHTQVDPATLADGIAHSLVVTLHGLLLSLVAVFFYFVFRSRLERVCASVGRIVDQVLPSTSSSSPS